MLPELSRREVTIEVTFVRIKLPHEPPQLRKDWRFLGYADVEFDDCFVVKDCRILVGGGGTPFVVFPSKKVTDRCPSCRAGNPIRARFCNECGGALDPDRPAPVVRAGRTHLHLDVCHPFRVGLREVVRDAVLEAYHDALADAEGAKVDAELAGTGPLSGRLPAAREVA